MGRILFSLSAILLLCFSVSAQEYDYCAGAGGSVGPVYTDCSQVGTHEFAWFGDYTGDTDKACYGSTDTDGTVVNAEIVASGTDPGTTSSTSGGNVTKHDTTDDRIAWPITAKNIFDSAEGMFCTDIYLSASTGQNHLFNIYVDSSNEMNLRVNADNTVTFTHRGAATLHYKTTTGTVSDTTWTNICARWSDANNAIGVKIGSSAWETSSAATVAFAAEPAKFYIGNKAVSNTFYLDNVTLDTESGL